MSKNKKLKQPNTDMATQSNQLIEASYRMSVPAKRVMLMLLGQIHPGQQDISGKIRIEAADYAEKTGVSLDQSYRDIKNGCRELMRTIITTRNAAARTTEECVVVHWMNYHESEGWLEATFTPWIAPFIHKLRNIGYKTISINEAVQFKRFYTIRLYELLMQWESSGIRLITLEDLRNSFSIDKKTANEALNLFEIDARGLDAMDRKLLTAVIEKFDGGPVGIDTLSSVVSEERDTLEEVYEPFLVQEGFLQRTPRGRVATPLAFSHLGFPPKTLF